MSKKLIEIALPLDVINDASAYDKMPGIGAHPKGLHQWWARLPLPSARAILFASLVDDPSSNPSLFPTEIEQEKERSRLFEIIRKMCQKKIHTHQEVFEEAHKEIAKHCGDQLPTLLDPFAGGGSIPLEGMRLGLSVEASDLNPIAVLINKAQLEILPSIANQEPINPQIEASKALTQWNLGKGLAEDLRYYGNWINDEAKKRLDKYYPRVGIGNKSHELIAWIWARTIICPNPACGCEMPLIRSFLLRSKKKPQLYTSPIIKRSGRGNKIVGYEIKEGVPSVKGTITRAGAMCICCNEPVPLKDIREYGRKKGYGTRLIGMVVENPKGKVYVAPNTSHEGIALSIKPIDNILTQKLSTNPRWFSPPLYGLTQYWQLFTPRQAQTLKVLTDLIEEVKKKIIADDAPAEYANALQCFLTLVLDRVTDFNNSLCRWNSGNEKVMNLYGRQAVPMVFDYGEANLIGNAVGAWKTCCEYISECVKIVLTTTSRKQSVTQFNASKYNLTQNKYLVSTDPPYYDNIGYSELSDFFYVWVRTSLKNLYPEIFSTMLVPKMEELVASDYRYGSKEAAKKHFEDGFKETFKNLKRGLDPRFPLTVYYAFKQEEDEDFSTNDDIEANGISLTTGWETLLESLLSTGFQITATWPIKASQKWRMVAMGTNALTSYIVLACRPRSEKAFSITRREYLQILKKDLPKAVEVLQHSNLAPVDMAQATIGPGIEIFSKYEKVMEQDGSTMSVRTALSLINQALGEILAEQEGDFDSETRWALAWFEQVQFTPGEFGDANALALAKNTAVSAMVNAGIVKSGSGRVKLVSRPELPEHWDPNTDSRIVVWEVTQHLIKQLQEKGEVGAASLHKKLGSQADVARELAYHLFTICEKKGWAQEAQAYNSLVLSWSQIVADSFNIKDSTSKQAKLDF